VSYASSTPEKVLRKQEQEKKKKYPESCPEQHQRFSLFICSTYGILGLEAQQLLKWLVGKLRAHWKTMCTPRCADMSKLK
jgi:hypothetical protein